MYISTPIGEICMQNKYCQACHVEVSADVTNCPLCGKYLGSQAQTSITDTTFPIYDASQIKRGKWVQFVRNACIVFAALCVLINVIFRDTIFWCLYSVVSLLCLYFVFVRPFKVKGFYLYTLTQMALFTVLLLVFIDGYNHHLFQTAFGWSIVYAVPSVLLGFIILVNILCLVSNKRDFVYVKASLRLLLYSLVLFVIKYCWVAGANWPVVASLCTALGLLSFVLIFKKQKLQKALIKKVHM